MKHTFSIFFVLALLSFGLTAQTINITDTHFKLSLTSSNCVDFDGDGYYDGDVDTNNDGEIQLSEALAVQRLSVNDIEINLLEGLQYFENLTHLYIDDHNNLSSFPQEGLANLLVLDCSGSGFTNLDLTIFPSLEEVDCSSNELVNLTVQGLQNLKKLKVRFNYDLATIDLSGLPSLEDLDLGFCLFTNIELVDLPLLREVNLSGNDLGSLEIVGFPALTTLELRVNNLSSLILAELPSLTVLSIFQNDLQTLDLSNNIPHLRELNANNCPLVNLNLQGLDSLSELDIQNNLLTTLELQNLPILEDVDCRFSNNLESIRLANLPEISRIDARDCPNLIQGEFENLPKLSALDMSDCPISTLNINATPLLYVLDINAADLAAVTYNLPHLGRLTCGGSALTFLDLTAMPNLRELTCNDAQMTSLDLSQNFKLEDLVLSQNHQLEQVNIKNGIQEEHLYIHDAPSLIYICMDEEDVSLVQEEVNATNGLENVSYNTSCSFDPGGSNTQLQGQALFDFDNDGCDSTDIIYPYLRYDLEGVSISTSVYSNANGIYNSYIPEGTFTLTPQPEQPGYFNISPEIATINITSNNEVVLQDFCVTPAFEANDASITIIALSTARPGFDASYEIVYKNQGALPLNGDITFTYNAATVEFLVASINATTEESGLLNWSFTDLLPFECRTIQLDFNVNSPMETPPVNNGDLLVFSAEI